ncbi:hypothetical protein CS542_08245 [Pedobacter sp. IW39]|nr:hypothetical protein CS542_08245 [Pedobacter sp. IW39]
MANVPLDLKDEQGRQLEGSAFINTQKHLYEQPTGGVGFESLIIRMLPLLFDVAQAWLKKEEWKRWTGQSIWENDTFWDYS